MDKQKFLNALLNAQMIEMPIKKQVKELKGNTIYWEIDPMDVAPWTGTSEIIKSDQGKYMITFPTTDFVTNVGKAKIIVVLVLDDTLLSKNQIERQLILFDGNNNILEKVDMLYSINPVTYNRTIPEQSQQINKEALHRFYTKYGISPLIISTFFKWLDHDLLPAVFKTMNGQQMEGQQMNGQQMEGQQMKGGSYYRMYMNEKKKYLSLKKN